MFARTTAHIEYFGTNQRMFGCRKPNLGQMKGQVSWN